MARQPQNQSSRNSSRQSNDVEDLHDDILSTMGVTDDEEDDTTDDVADDEDDDNLDPHSGEDDDLAGDDDDSNDSDEELTRRYDEDPKTKNLVDKRGQVVAKAGKERTVFERMKVALQAEQRKTLAIAKKLQDVARAGELAFEKYKEAKASSEYHKSIGLTADQAKEAVDLYARFNTDPMGALRNIMTKMHLSGVDLKELGVSQPLDAKAIADQAIREYSAKNKPVAKTPQEEALETAKSFVDRFPDALQMQEVIGRAKQQYPEKSLDEIYVKLKVHDAVWKLARQYGIDLSKPPRKGAAPQGNGRDNNPPQRQGQRNAPVAHNSVDRGSKRRSLDTTPRDHKQSWDSIGAELLRDIKELEG